MPRKPVPFETHLTVRSGFSFRWGAATPEKLARRARERGFKSLALTDRNNLCGLYAFRQACAEEGITPITGAELVTEKQESATLLALSEDGYQRLSHLLSQRHLQPELGARELFAFGLKGLALLSDDPALVMAGEQAGAEFSALELKGKTSPLVRTAKAMGLKTAVSGDVSYADPEDLNLHRLLRAIDLGYPKSRLSARHTAHGEAWLQPAANLTARFETVPEALRFTREIAEAAAAFQPSFDWLLPPWQDVRGLSAEKALALDADEGARWRYGTISPVVRRRLDKELDLIWRKGFAAYFLLVRDIVRVSPRTCGRGSGAASVVAYCLGITNVDPIRHNLLFARFLNEGRIDPPDIDVDFAWDERDDVLEHVFSTYGRDHTAMICNHLHFQPRMAIRETARAHGMPNDLISQVSKRLPWFWRARLQQDGPEDGAVLARDIPNLPTMANTNLPDPWPAILLEAASLLGLPRHLSVHCGGVVITPEPVWQRCPVQVAPKGVRIIQWEKDGAEAFGLLKLDLLGNRSLAVIRDAVEAMGRQGRTLDEDQWDPVSDPDTCRLVAKGDTVGVFYVESPSMRLLQQRARTGDFEHLVIHSSIIRPAANTWIQEYLRRLHGGDWQPLHPALKNTLDSTYGIPIYQEDVSRILMDLAGFNETDADQVRKVLSKKHKEKRLRDYRLQFAKGAKKNGASDEVIDQVWDMILSFDGYSFCKPHSASYAQVSYQSAWLRAHEPAAFMAAVLSNGGGFYPTLAYLEEARRMGVDVLAPTVNRAHRSYQAEDRFRLRVGLDRVAHLRTDSAERIVGERRARGLFRDLGEFLSRVPLNQEELTHLVNAGALDELCPEWNRPRILWAAQAALHQCGAQHGRVDHSRLFSPTVAAPPDLPDWSERTRLRREFSTLGFLTERHPISLFRDLEQVRGTSRAADLPRLVGRQVRTAAWMISGKPVRTKHGDPMEFICFQDETGFLEATVFPKVYERHAHMLASNRPYLVSGRVEEEYGVATLNVDRITALPRPR